MVTEPADTTNPLPRVWPAVAGLMALQMVIAYALFAPGIVGPRIGLDTGIIGLFSMVTFLVGTLTSLYGGVAAARFGSFAVAAACATAVVGSMVSASFATSAGLLVSAVLLGCAFGPETPASSALLARIVPPARQPFVFSVRQTGNQIGAILGSLTLPTLAAWLGQSAFLVSALLAIVAVGLMLGLRDTYDRVGRGSGGQRIDVRASLALVRADPPLMMLAVASMAFAAMQLAINAFFVTHAVDNLRIGHVTAGILLALAQAGGLVGRLVWGAVAPLVGGPLRVLVGLGIGMSVTVGLLAAADVRWPIALLGLLMILIGVTASGWNGIFLAEVARRAPAGRVAEATGAVLVACYSGLVVGPLVIAGVASLASLSASYAVLALLTGAATWLIWKGAK